MQNVSRKDVPAVIVPRLAVYLRKLKELRARGVERVSSRDLAAMIGLNAAQIRKDLSYFGEFGTRGVGYEVDRLWDVLRHSLALDRVWNLAIVGAGPLGTALARYRHFADWDYRLAAVFDSSPGVIGARYGPAERDRVLPVGDLERVCREEPVHIAMLAVPPDQAQAIADRLAAAGVRAMLNFAPVRVQTPEDVVVRQVDLSSELMVLSFYLDRDGEPAPAGDSERP